MISYSDVEQQFLWNRKNQVMYKNQFDYL